MQVLVHHLRRMAGFYRYPQKRTSGARLAVLAECCTLLGKLRMRLPFTMPLEVAGHKSSIRVRDRRDLGVIEEVFVGGDYDFSYLETPSVILDIGSNIGASVRYFSLRYPECEVFCCEPNPIIANRLVENTQGHSVTHCTLAVGATDGFIKFYADVAKPASSSTINRGAGESVLSVPCLSLKTLLAIIGKPIDILKFDVEGSEVALFKDANLSTVREIVGEVHLDLIEMGVHEFAALVPDFTLVAAKTLTADRLILHFRNNSFDEGVSSEKNSERSHGSSVIGKANDLAAT